WQVQLVAVRNQDGKESPAVSEVLLIYPAATPARSWEIRWLTGSLQWIVGLSAEERAGQGCPIHLCDPCTGMVIQRLNLPASPSTVGSAMSGGRDWVVTPRLRTAPLLTAIGPTVHCGPNGLVVGHQGQVWGYRELTNERQGAAD